jgi:hypothetical protein
MTQKHMFANMPPVVRAAYEEAQRRFSQTIKSAEDPSRDKPEVVTQRREAAAVVVNADLLADAIGRRKGIKPDSKTEGKPTQFSEAVNVLERAMEQVRTRHTVKAAENTKSTPDKPNAVSVPKPSLAELLLAGSEE